MNLITILLLLFTCLFIVVKLTERFGRSMDAEKQSKLSRIALILIAVMLVARLIKEVM